MSIRFPMKSAPPRHTYKSLNIKQSTYTPYYKPLHVITTYILYRSSKTRSKSSQMSPHIQNNHIMRLQHKHPPTRTYSWWCTPNLQHGRQIMAQHMQNLLTLHPIYNTETFSWQGGHNHTSSSLIDGLFTNLPHHTQMICKTLLNYNQILITHESP